MFNKWQENHGGDVSNDLKQLFEHGTSLVYGKYLMDIAYWFLFLFCFVLFCIFYVVTFVLEPLLLFLSLLHQIVGNLLFRLLHNLFFGSFLPRHRVCISLMAIFSSMFLLSLIYFWFEATSVVWVYVCYIVGGIGVGTFEANLLATITPLGPDTKVWALVGMPAGFTIISVFGYALMGLFDVSVVFLYLFDAFTCLIGIFIWYYRIPINSDSNMSRNNDANSQTLKDFVGYLKDWRQWLLKIKINCLALCVDMFCVAFFSAINQYILTGTKIPLFGMCICLLFLFVFFLLFVPLGCGCARILENVSKYSSIQETYKHTNIQTGGNSLLVNTDDFFSVYSFLSFVGDASGRKLIYYFKYSKSPIYFLSFSIGGAFLCLLKIPVLTWVGYFLIFLANGLIYASTTRKIDAHILKQWSLTSLSIWLFVGDLGSVTGSNVWQFVDNWVCPKKTKYFCNS